MSYVEAFEALKNGDFKTAVPLLERAGRETSFGSDIINHAYTLALYHANETSQLADVAFQVGSRMTDNDPGSAMDYFQRALFAGLDAERTRRIGEVHEGWAAPPHDTPSVGAPIRKVAHVVGSVAPGNVLSEYVNSLVRSLSYKGIESSVFTTESIASWFFNSAAVPLSDVAGFPEVTIASVEGDFVERASRVAAAITASGAQVAFYHASLAEQITARVASMRPTRIQVHVNHEGTMDADLFDGYIHVLKKSMDESRSFGRPSEWIPLAAEIEQQVRPDEPVSRRSLGLEAAESVSATFDDLRNAAGAGFIRALTEILNRFPNHFHLFVGPGNIRGLRAALHAEGVLPRVRFLGNVSSVGPLMSAADLVLAPFPDLEAASVVRAMGAGKPVVVLREVELLGTPDLVASGEAHYVEIVDRLIRNPSLRTKYSSLLRERFEAEFKPSSVGERYHRFIERFS
jgi:hypothetical protein